MHPVMQKVLLALFLIMAVPSACCLFFIKLRNRRLWRVSTFKMDDEEALSRLSEYRVVRRRWCGWAAKTTPEGWQVKLPKRRSATRIKSYSRQGRDITGWQMAVYPATTNQVNYNEDATELHEPIRLEESARVASGAMPRLPSAAYQRPRRPGGVPPPQSMQTSEASEAKPNDPPPEHPDDSHYDHQQVPDAMFGGELVRSLNQAFYFLFAARMGKAPHLPRHQFGDTPRTLSISSKYSRRFPSSLDEFDKRLQGGDSKVVEPNEADAEAGPSVDATTTPDDTTAQGDANTPGQMAAQENTTTQNDMVTQDIVATGEYPPMQDDTTTQEDTTTKEDLNSMVRRILKTKLKLDYQFEDEFQEEDEMETYFEW